MVQLALEMMVSEPSKIFSLTPKTTVLILSTSDGADRITFFAPAKMCAFISSKVLNFPVDSTTISIFKFFQFNFPISFSWKNKYFF